MPDILHFNNPRSLLEFTHRLLGGTDPSWVSISRETAREISQLFVTRANQLTYERKDKEPWRNGFESALQRYVATLGCMTPIEVIEPDSKDAYDVGVTTFNIDAGTAYIDTWEKNVKTMEGRTTQRVYRVYWMKHHPGTRIDPPDEEDVTEYEGVGVNNIFGAVGALLARDAAQRAWESLDPEY